MRVDVVTVDPRVVRQLHNAAVRDCEPPRGMGQPTECKAAPRSTPGAELIGSFRLSKECAASPAKTALVRSWRNKLPASVVAGGNALKPKRAISQGRRGKRRTGRRTSGARSLQRLAKGLISLCHAFPSEPREE